jgi:3-methyladenine DNA glycosylase AlkC
MAEGHTSDDSDSTKNPALKDTLFDAGRFRIVAREAARLAPRFDAQKFLAISLDGLDQLSLMQRLRRMTEALRATLPQDYRRALGILKKLAPATGPGFAALAWPDYVAQHGHGRGDFEVSMDALKFFTTFGSSEFAVREFLRRDLRGTLTVMEGWSRDGDEAVRRLACEGCRPRLPWSFRLEALVADPSPVAPILENLRADPSLFVRKSVGNHLNDITKDHPDWVLRRVAGWPLEDTCTAWIVRRGLRTLIKKGDRQALALIGAGEKPRVRAVDFRVEPREVRLGGRVVFSFRLESAARKAQRLVVDYAVHYVRKNGGTSAKVFKLVVPEKFHF